MAELSLETWLLALVLSSVLFGASAVAFHLGRSLRPQAVPQHHAPDGASDGVASPEILQENGLRLVNEAATILKIIRQQMDAGDRFSTSLAEADRRLPKLSDPEQVRLVVKFLVAENAKMQEEQSELKTRLEHAQCQVEALRFKVAEVEEESLRDPLTSVSNRRGFDIALAAAMAESKTLKSPLCLVMCDLDHFKKLNDTYGHPTGDEVLKAFATVLSESVRDGDTIARYGGEEFAVILARSDMKGAARLCERMRLEIAQRKLPVDDEGKILENVTASFGIAQYLAGDTAETLIKRADAKLYEAKNGGRNRVAIDLSALAA